MFFRLRFSVAHEIIFCYRALAEHCFSLNEDERVRIIQILESNQGKPFLSKIEVHKERKDGPYNGGQVLSGIWLLFLLPSIVLL